MLRAPPFNQSSVLSLWSVKTVEIKAPGQLIENAALFKEAATQASPAPLKKVKLLHPPTKTTPLILTLLLGRLPFLARRPVRRLMSDLAQTSGSPACLDMSSVDQWNIIQPDGEPLPPLIEARRQRHR